MNLLSQAQKNDETNLEIVLKMAMEPELRLKFSTYSQFCVWKSGLHLMTQLLELPSNPLQVSCFAPRHLLTSHTHT